LGSALPISPRVPKIDVDEILRAICLEFADHFLTHACGVLLSHDQAVHVEIANGRMAPGIEIDFGFGAQDRDARSLRGILPDVVGNSDSRDKRAIWICRLEDSDRLHREIRLALAQDSVSRRSSKDEYRENRQR